jgi:hypothetical protein
MEGLHVVGDILTKISVNCVIKLYVALLFTCVFLWVYHMCGYNCLYIYGYCLYMLHACVYCYFTMNLCIYTIYLSIYVLYIMFCKSSVCIYFNCMQFKKFMWQLGAGYVTVCSVERTKMFSRVSWPDHGWSGTLHQHHPWHFLSILASCKVGYWKFGSFYKINHCLHYYGTLQYYCEYI